MVFRRNAGAVVAPVDGRAYAAALETLAVVEGYATALAAPHLTPADLDRLQALNGEMAAALARPDLVRFSALNRQFHEVIYSRCPNPYLVEVARRTQERIDQMRRTVFAFIPERAWASLDEHAQILAAIAGGDPPDRIEFLARQHKLNTLRAFAVRGRCKETEEVHGHAR